MRRQYSGEVKYCWPVSCWPVATSHSRNSAFSRPSRLPRHAAGDQRLGVDGLPALELRRGVDIADLLDDRRPDRSARTSPLRLRLLVMTWATPTPTSASAGVPATKFGIAIGSGATLPSVICSLVCASAARRQQQARGRAGAADQDLAAAQAATAGKTGRHHGHCWAHFNECKGNQLRNICARIEGDDHVFPLIVGLRAAASVGLPCSTARIARIALS